MAPSGDQMWSSGASGSTKFENNAIITINEFGSVVDQPLYVDFCECGIRGALKPEFFKPKPHGDFVGILSL